MSYGSAVGQVARAHSALATGWQGGRAARRSQGSGAASTRGATLVRALGGEGGGRVLAGGAPGGALGLRETLVVAAAIQIVAPAALIVSPPRRVTDGTG